MAGEIIKERMLKNLREAIGDHFSYNGNSHEVLKGLFLTDLNGSCLPDEYTGEDVLKEIEDKFYFFLGAIRDQFEQYIEIYVTPSYEDSTAFLMILEDKVLIKDHWKAWNFWYESEDELADEMYRIYLTLEAKSEKTYECYTLTDADIQEVAEQKGISLDGIDLDDVVHYIKKGIGYALDNRDEIIAEAIRLAGIKPAVMGLK